MRGKVDDVGKLAKKEDTPTHLPMDVRSTCASAQEVSSDTTIAQNGAPVKKNIRGSPPRVRGKVAMEHFSIAICGITPAYAGKSSCSRPGSLSSRDHPRVCGEKRKTGAVPAPLPGSPPRMRGKARSHAQLYYDAGKSCTSFQLMFFIWDHPAYAGKRPVLFSDSWIHRDHPRVCGEKFKPFCLRQLCQGSPPRMRGKAPRIREDLERMGITPAYAGRRWCQ